MSQQINLFNPIFLTQKKYFSAVAMGQGLGLILLGVVFFLAYSHFQLSSLQSQENQTIAQAAVVDAQLSKVKRENIPHSKNLVLENSVATMDAEIQSLQQAFDILKKGDIGDTGGYAVFLRAFSRQIVDGVWLTGFNIVGAGNEMSLQGRALRPELVAAYIGRLKNESIMQGKNFSSLDIRMSGPTPPAHSATIPTVEFDLRSPTIGTQLATSSVDLSPAVVPSPAVAPAAPVVPSSSVAPSKSVALAAPIVSSAPTASSALPSASTIDSCSMNRALREAITDC
ncbi:PilN domain-containing protein, partial [Glaciimonas sp. GG7]